MGAKLEYIKNKRGEIIMDAVEISWRDQLEGQIFNLDNSNCQDLENPTFVKING